MSLLSPKQYSGTSNGALPLLLSSEAPETVVAAGTAGAPASVTTSTCYVALTATGNVYFQPSAAQPDIGHVKMFNQTAAFAATVLPGTNTVFKQGAVVKASVTLGTALTQYCWLQYTGKDSTGKYVYKIVNTNGTVA